MRHTAAAILPLVLWACTRDDRPDVAMDSAMPAGYPPNAEAWVVRPDSFGPLPLGVPLAQAESALGGSIQARVPELEGCAEVRPGALPSGTSLMVIRDTAGDPVTVERVDVHTAGVRTREGAGVGDMEDSVLAMYRGRIQVQPHKYTGPEGHYLVVSNPRDTSFLLIFETDGRRVTRFRAGRRPAVEYVEGCA